MQTIDIFIRTYVGDAQWLPYCLKSIHKFCKNFSNIIIVTPESSKIVIEPIASEFGTEFYICDKLNTDDYVGQQGTKMLADTWCKSDAICFVDSDVIFIRDTAPNLIISESGCINLVKTAYNTIECPWQSITENAVGFPVEFEYMRRMPLTYNRDLLEFTRTHIEKNCGRTFTQFINEVSGRELSEFNILGAIAEKFMPEKFNFIDSSKDPLPELYAKQFWSWGRVTPDIKQQIEEILSINI